MITIKKIFKLTLSMFTVLISIALISLSINAFYTNELLLKNKVIEKSNNPLFFLFLIIIFLIAGITLIKLVVKDYLPSKEKRISELEDKILKYSLEDEEKLFHYCREMIKVDPNNEIAKNFLEAKKNLEN